MDNAGTGDAASTHRPARSRAGAFRSLRRHNCRLWMAGTLVSNVGTWVQRTAQDWLVLTVLTPGSASSLGIVMALQFGPPLLFLPWTGSAADRLDRRRLLIATQAAMAALALTLGALTASGLVRLWHVYVLAALLGSVAAFDVPVRQVFVAEVVGDDELHGAVTLNSMSFNIANLLGPAVAGLVIAACGIGWAFVLNGLSFMAVLVSLVLLRRDELHRSERTATSSSSFRLGLAYVAGRPDLLAILAMLLLVGTFALNVPIFISVMALRVFGTDAQGFGLLSSMLAAGTIAGGVVGAMSGRPSVRTLLWSAALLAVGLGMAAVAPGLRSFAAALLVVGLAYLTFMNASNALMQLSTPPAMRGRVIALRFAVVLGGTAVGAPIIGWVADHLGPRWALGVGAAAGLAAAGIAASAIRRGLTGPSTGPSAASSADAGDVPGRHDGRSIVASASPRAVLPLAGPVAARGRAADRG